MVLWAAVVLVSATEPVLADNESDCFQQKDPQLRVKACSGIIERDPNDATAYHNRAVAYGLAGDVDHAIADYTKTIEIKPDNAAAYENRGRAYASKGDYTRALADVMKGSELVAKTAIGLTAIKPKPTKATTATPPKTPPKTAMIAPKKAVARASVPKEPPESIRPAWTSILDTSAD
jgi:tetratricopeptide (TPR) repeat protein